MLLTDSFIFDNQEYIRLTKKLYFYLQNNMNNIKKHWKRNKIYKLFIYRLIDSKQNVVKYCEICFLDQQLKNIAPINRMIIRKQPFIEEKNP